MDPQRNTSQASDVLDPERSVTDVLGQDISVKDAIVKCKYYDLLAADKYLTNVEKALIDRPDLASVRAKLENAGVSLIQMTLLRDCLAPVQTVYDYIVIDTPPALGNLSYMALVAADYVLIPTEPSSYGLTGLADLQSTITAVQGGLNPNLKVLGVLLVKFNRRTLLARDLKDLIDEYCVKMDTSIFSATIRESVAVKEAQMVRKPLIDYAPNNNATIDYKGAVTELQRRISLDNKRRR